MTICRHLIAAAVLLVTLTGCGTTVQVHARFPANDPDAAPLRRVAVADFEGPEGDHFAYALEAMLAGADFDGQRYFTLTDSGRRGTGADSGVAARYGRSVGSDGVYYGRMQSAYFDNSRWEERSTECVKKDDAGKCVKKETVVTPCLRRSFSMEIYPALVNVRTGSVVYNAHKTAGTETSWCRGESQPISDDAMIDGAINNILGQIRPDIAPYNTILRATVIEKKDGLSDPDGKAFDAAVSAAGKGDIVTACRSWGEIARTNPSHPWTVYNLGVCAEANGDFTGALTRYEKARSLSPTANRDVAESIDRVTRLIAAQQELRRSQKSKKK